MYVRHKTLVHIFAKYNRFSKFLYRYTQKESCNKIIIKIHHTLNASLLYLVKY